jgi:hypothetical protein
MYCQKLRHRATSVLQDCGFSSFLEAFVLNQTLVFFETLVLKTPIARIFIRARNNKQLCSIT